VTGAVTEAVTGAAWVEYLVPLGVLPGASGPAHPSRAQTSGDADKVRGARAEPGILGRGGGGDGALEGGAVGPGVAPLYAERERCNVAAATDTGSNSYAPAAAEQQAAVAGLQHSRLNSAPHLSLSLQHSRSAPLSLSLSLYSTRAPHLSLYSTRAPHLEPHRPLRSTLEWQLEDPIAPPHSSPIGSGTP
jgi:hypothetical protein